MGVEIQLFEVGEYTKVPRHCSFRFLSVGMDEK
jgi:hypothetical protein